MCIYIYIHICIYIRLNFHLSLLNVISYQVPTLFKNYSTIMKTYFYYPVQERQKRIVC